MSTSHGRAAVAYVVGIDGNEVVLNLHESHKGRVASHALGVSAIGQPGDLLVAEGATGLIVLRVVSLFFAEAREAHRKGVGTQNLYAEPLRQVVTRSIGQIKRRDRELWFEPGQFQSPALGAEVYPITYQEFEAVLLGDRNVRHYITVGTSVNNPTVPVKLDFNSLLARHFAVLGATGQGKTHFIAAILRTIVLNSGRCRIVIFDVNGEYLPAFADMSPECVRYTVLGHHGGRRLPDDCTHFPVNQLRLPYFALGRPGLTRLLMPSERTQMPALRFAIEHLRYVESNGDGARLVGQRRDVLFDDCRNDGAAEAYDALQKIRNRECRPNTKWPHMRALSCLAAEWSALSLRNGNPERNSFSYGNVQPLINRIRERIEDERFCDVVDVTGGKGVTNGQDWVTELDHLVHDIFGSPDEVDWSVHVVDLSRLAEDLTPFILGALLESLSSSLFRRGPGASFPTLLVLEEAHHYLREFTGEARDGSPLAYERLAKEGRKYNLSMLVSTQRPSELSPTVLAQCGTWAVFRLTNEQDQRAVSVASEWGEKHLVSQIPGLPRGQAVVFGAACSLPLRVSVIRPEKEPDSQDSKFADEWQYGG